MIKELTLCAYYQWNVSGWDQYNMNKSGKNYQSLMMELVKKQDADVLC